MGGPKIFVLSDKLGQVAHDKLRAKHLRSIQLLPLNDVFSSSKRLVESRAFLSSQERRKREQEPPPCPAD